MLNLHAFKTLTEILDHYAQVKSFSPAYSFHHFPSTEVEKISFGELREKSLSIAHALVAKKLPSRNVILIFSPGLKFIEVFFGCLYAGLHPIPMPAPMVQKQIFRVLNVFQNSASSAVLTDSRLFQKMSDFIPSEVKSSIDLINCDVLENSRGGFLPQVESENTAFIQYTSGSVGDPKGVIISHRNILHNERAIREAFEHNEDTLVVSWLPMFHDMGLIGNVLQPLTIGVHSVLMSPFAFIQKPLRWLELITFYKATTSGGPNFGYDLCMKNITDDQKEGLDLRSWTLAYSGAEPVRSSTIKNFVVNFERCGFNERAFYPCYGLAESTLFVTGVKKGAPLRTLQIDIAKYACGKAVETESRENSLVLTSCGAPHPSVELIIVDPDSKLKCAEGEVGEIWTTGDSKAMGYWNNAQINANIFEAKVKDSSKSYLRTGDLGFLKDGDLFITGRIKDTIIIRGSNYYPQDIEHVIESGLHLPPGSTAAFSLEVNDDEMLIILTELPLTKLDVTELVTKNFGIRPYAVEHLERNRLPRSSSGKLQRFLCKQIYQEMISKK